MGACTMDAQNYPYNQTELSEDKTADKLRDLDDEKAHY
jgi:hypothetical protein